MTPTRTGRPSAAACLLMVLCAWPALHVAAYVLGTTAEALFLALLQAAGFAFGALVAINLVYQIIRR